MQKLLRLHFKKAQRLEISVGEMPHNPMLTGKQHTDIIDWVFANKLKLNGDKTEVICPAPTSAHINCVILIDSV